MNTKEIWDIYSDELKRFIISRVKNESLADDILQDVFIKIHVNLQTLKNKSKLKPWVFQIGRNTMMNYFKSNHITYEFEDSLTKGELQKQEHNEFDCLQGILKNLPKKYQNPIFLADIKGLKQQEVARQLKLPLPTVKSQIQRGRKLIAQGFMDCCGFVMNEKGNLVGEVREKEDCKVCN